MTADPHPDTAPPTTAETRTTEQGPGGSMSLNSDALLRGQKAVTISHNGSLYRLQTTRQGKLILTK